MTACVKCLVVWAMAMPAFAAPLDVFLSATPEQIAPRGYLEVGSDHMNESLDVFKVREDDPLIAGTQAGDYSAGYVSGAVKVAEGVWLSGSLGRSSVSSTSDTYNYNNWRVSGLYRIKEANGAMPALALRFSAWGNNANATESTTAVVVPGARLNTVKITDPADQQLQADLVGTWALTPAQSVSAFISGGSTKLSYGSLSATTTRNGCDYNVAFTGNDIFLTRARPCTLPSADFYFDSSGEYGVDVASEIAWRGSFVQAGVNSLWQRGPWTVQMGYMFHVVKRRAVDDILKARGDTSYTHNHNITVQANYRLTPHLSIFGRGQITSNLFFNDIPVAYNSSTAERFGSKYSVFSVGLRASF